MRTQEQQLRLGRERRNRSEVGSDSRGWLRNTCILGCAVCVATVVVVAGHLASAQTTATGGAEIPSSPASGKTSKVRGDFVLHEYRDKPWIREEAAEIRDYMKESGTTLDAIARPLMSNVVVGATASRDDVLWRKGSRALSLLGQLRVKSAVPLLQRMLEVGHVDYQNEALRAMVYIGTPESLRTPDDVVKGNARYTWNHRSAVLGAIRDRLRYEPRLPVQSIVLETNKSAREELINMVHQALDSDRKVEQHCWLEMLGEQRRLDVLLVSLDDEAHYRHSKQRLDRLVKCRSHTEEFVRDTRTRLAKILSDPKVSDHEKGLTEEGLNRDMKNLPGYFEEQLQDFGEVRDGP